jgi:hypothetical protein
VQDTIWPSQGWSPLVAFDDGRQKMILFDNGPDRNGAGACDYPQSGTACGTCRTCDGSGSCFDVDPSQCGTGQGGASGLPGSSAGGSVGAGGVISGGASGVISGGAGGRRNT